ncbi:Hsp33 family molecular chaperone HslO [Pullulanibacillus sp. KACC 23026]|uniref:Hsp33 family molecular chaperone HslO n=1 Tax=Pullulanibacillus sp. KACC 23026 TaxID=3028315 RepID=UPI0023B1E673|nr:Hsp33 family molecular chaperone HslO [Pullulanibacillus sp. KACC 23026]WEG12710.1 Hsp33 family molecular chaperone HslO [Pullulanibacillus sp. KACC 23026]
MSDYLVKALGYGGQIRAEAIRSTEMVSEAQRRQTSWPTVSAALGRTMTAATMMGVQLKGDGRLTVTVEGGGPVGAIIVDSNSKGETRGYVTNPHVHFELNKHGKLDVARVVGTDGYLSVVKDLGLKDTFTGRVPIVSGEIGEDFTYYFASSEQIPSAVGVGVLVNPDNSIKAAGGFLIQVLPGAEDHVIQQLETRLKEIPAISKLIDQGLTPEEILETIFGKEDVKILETMPVTFKCQCSREKLENALIGLGKEEIQSMIEEDHGAEATCHFCNEVYRFSEEDLRELIKD